MPATAARIVFHLVPSSFITWLLHGMDQSVSKLYLPMQVG